MDREALERLIYRVIGSMIEVHTVLGPGFIESVYRKSLLVELRKRGIAFETEVEVPLDYKGEGVGVHRLDLFVEKELVIEIKAVSELHKKHYAQLRSYLKATQKPIGLLVNFADFEVDVRRVELPKSKP